MKLPDYPNGNKLKPRFLLEMKSTVAFPTYNLHYKAASSSHLVEISFCFSSVLIPISFS